MNLCNSNCLLLIGRKRPPRRWRHLVSEPRKHPGLWNCSRPESHQKKQLSIIHGPSLYSHIPAPHSDQPPLEMKKRENTQPGTRWVNKWAHQIQEWGPVFLSDSPQTTHSVSFLLGNGKERHRYTLGIAQFVLLPLQSLPVLYRSERDWDFTSSIGRDRGQRRAMPDVLAVGQGYHHLPPEV